MKCILIVLLIFPLFVMSQIQLPEGFTELNKSPSNGKKMDATKVLFDNDSLEDTAVIVQNENEFSKYKLLIYLTSSKKQYEVDLYSNSDFSIYPIPIKVSKNVIEYGYYEDGTLAFGRFIKLRFSSKHNKIQVIGHDLEYKASASRYIKKSYNLLNGKYLVATTTFNEAHKEDVTSFSGINPDFKNKVFVENLDLEMLINLDTVFTEVGIGIVSINFNDKTIIEFYKTSDLAKRLKLVEFFNDESIYSWNIKNLEKQKEWLAPESMWLDYGEFKFRCKSKLENCFEIYVSDTQTMWIKKQDFTEFIDWEAFLKSMFSVERSNKNEQKIYTQPSAESEIIESKTDCFNVKQMQGEWIEVETANHCETDRKISGWVQWRNGNTILINYYTTS